MTSRLRDLILSRAIAASVFGFGLGMLALAFRAAVADADAAPVPPTSVTIRLSPRAAHGLLRSLSAGAPMAGPEVAPLIATLAAALGDEAPPAPPSSYGEPTPIDAY